MIQFVLLGAMAVAFFLLPPQFEGFRMIIGGALVSGGLLLIFWAITEHGRTSGQTPNIVPDPKANAMLVTSGPYRQVRHPIYSGVLLMALGASLLHGHPVGYILTVALFLLFSVKARYEESLLRQVYPDYAAYITRSGRFWPRFGG